MDQQAVVEQQIALYGEPLGARFSRLTSAYRISQAGLAQVIGLSPPMLSQLSTAQRVKISNPAVYGRLLRLEELAQTDRVKAGDPQVLEDALTGVAASNPALSTKSHYGQGRAQLTTLLAEFVSPEELRQGAAATHGALSELLEAAARHAASRGAANQQDTGREGLPG